MTWRSSAEGRLAEIIVLAQFSRNLYRDQANAFTSDGMALGLAQEGIALGLDHQLTTTQRSLLYMRFVHSESAQIHQTTLQLFTALANPQNLRYEELHQATIDRFNRYPHRNQILGRTSTPEEIEFLQQPNSSF